MVVLTVHVSLFTLRHPLRPRPPKQTPSEAQMAGGNETAPITIYTSRETAPDGGEAARSLLHPSHVLDPRESDWLALSAQWRGRPWIPNSNQAMDPSALLPSTSVASTLLEVEDLLAAGHAVPLAVLWHNPSTFHIPLDSGTLVRVELARGGGGSSGSGGSARKIATSVVTDLASIVIDTTLASNLSDPFVDPGAAMAEGSPLTRRKKVRKNTVRWSAVHLAPHFVLGHLPHEGVLRLYYSATRHKLLTIERDAKSKLARPEWIDVPFSHTGPVRFESHGTHIAVVTAHVVHLYERLEPDGRMKLNFVTSIHSPDPIRAAHFPSAAALILVYQSDPLKSTTTASSTTEVWCRAYRFEAKKSHQRAWIEIDARGSVLSLDSTTCGVMTSWAAGPSYSCAPSQDTAASPMAPSTAFASTGPTSSTPRRGALSVSLIFGTALGRIVHLAVRLTDSAADWDLVGGAESLATPVFPDNAAPVVHVAVHPCGWAVAAADSTGRVVLVDLAGNVPFSVRHAMTTVGGPATPATRIDLLSRVPFTSIPSLLVWAPSAGTTDESSGGNTVQPPAVATLVVVFDRGPIVTVAVDGLVAARVHAGMSVAALQRVARTWPVVSSHHASDVVLASTALLARGDMHGALAAAHRVLFISTTTDTATVSESTRAAAGVLVRKSVQRLTSLGHVGRAVLAAVPAASHAGVQCGDQLLVAAHAARVAGHPTLAAAAHLEFQRACAVPYPRLLIADPTSPDGVASSLDETIAYYRDRVNAAGTVRRVSGEDAVRAAVWHELRGDVERAGQCWRRAAGSGSAATGPDAGVAAAKAGPRMAALRDLDIG
ncbi:hypothetical protein BC828DRAFT_408191 [Blastocladiella britannica]|nr:hypothetical protein BC828DRAFT_408191 [Blastocladiella britannica]